MSGRLVSVEEAQRMLSPVNGFMPETTRYELAHTVVVQAEQIAALMRVATGEVDHLWEGSCPDALTGADSRDPGCHACRILGATS